MPGVDGDCLVIEADTAEALNYAEIELLTRAAALSLTATPSIKKIPQRSRDNEALKLVVRNIRQTTLYPEIRRHIFVDNSNVFIGAQTKGELFYYILTTSDLP